MAVDRGLLRATMPFLKLVGNRSGTIEVRTSPSPDAGPAGQWVAVIGQLLPPLTRLAYDTATGSVDLYYEADDRAMRLCVEKLVEVAAESAVRFMTADKVRLSRMRALLAKNLESSPIDLREDDATERLQKIIDRL